MLDFQILAAMLVNLFQWTLSAPVSRISWAVLLLLRRVYRSNTTVQQAAPTRSFLPFSGQDRRSAWIAA